MNEIVKKIFSHNCFFSGASIPKSLILLLLILIVSPSVTTADPEIISL